MKRHTSIAAALLLMFALATAAHSQTATVNYKLCPVNEYTDEMCCRRGPDVYMYVVGKRPYPLDGPLTLKLDAPASWRVQTGMDEGPSPNNFTAPKYDAFIEA